jgi:hypothetical protein
MFLPLYFCGPAMPANVRLSPDSDRSAGRLDDASTMLNDFGIDERFFEGLEMSKRAFLVRTQSNGCSPRHPRPE